MNFEDRESYLSPLLRKILPEIARFVLKEEVPDIEVDGVATPQHWTASTSADDFIDYLSDSILYHLEKTDLLDKTEQFENFLNDVADEMTDRGCRVVDFECDNGQLIIELRERWEWGYSVEDTAKWVMGEDE